MLIFKITKVKVEVARCFKNMTNIIVRYGKQNIEYIFKELLDKPWTHLYLIMSSFDFLPFSYEIK